jgi:eukaryotic-like serine/threonine-protein kinase
MIGAVLKGEYRILQLVGVGGFASVYLARDTESNCVVAVKVLKEEHTEDPSFTSSPSVVI